MTFMAGEEKIGTLYIEKLETFSIKIYYQRKKLRRKNYTHTSF